MKTKINILGMTALITGVIFFSACEKEDMDPLFATCQDDCQICANQNDSIPNNNQNTHDRSDLDPLCTTCDTDSITDIIISDNVSTQDNR